MLFSHEQTAGPIKLKDDMIKKRLKSIYRPYNSL